MTIHLTRAQLIAFLALVAAIVTITALRRLIAARGLNCSQGERYLDLARNRAANEEFLFGWLANRVGVAA